MGANCSCICNCMFNFAQSIEREKMTTEQLPFVPRYNGRKVFGNTSFEFLFEFNYVLNSRKNSLQAALFSLRSPGAGRIGSFWNLENFTIRSEKNFPMKFLCRSVSFHCLLLNWNTFYFIYYLSFCLSCAINHMICWIFLCVRVCVWRRRKYSISFYWIDGRDRRISRSRTVSSMQFKLKEYYAINNKIS